jgi:hypothetical protein
MANSQTYVDGFTPDGAQITTLSGVQGAGLRLPSPTSQYINIRSPGKLEGLFSIPGNSNVLYTTNKPQDLYLKGPVASQMFVYRNIEEGQRNKLTTVFQASRQDGTRVRKFLGSSAGTKFILKQLVLQGFQPFDETKVYNPASPIIAALRLASFGLVDRPTRHLDTSNIVGGLLGASGLGSIARTVGGLFGDGGPALPSPPRSSVASTASGGLGLSTFTSLLGGADRADQVVSPLARPDVRDLLRGQTATNAYNAPRYNKLVSSGGGSFFSKLLGGVGNFLQNNTLIGGIIPPKQPWSSKYRADEQTYDLYLVNGKLFDVSGITPTKSNGSGIMSQLVSGVKNALGLGTTTKFTGLAAGQRFYHASVNRPSFQRYDTFINANGLKNYTASTGILEFNNVENAALNIISREVASLTQEGVDRFNNPVLSGVNGKPTTQIKYTDVVKADRTNGTLTEQSDQLLNYKVLALGAKTLPDTFVNINNQSVKDIATNLSDNLNKIISYGNNYIATPLINNVLPQQFAQVDIKSKQFKNDKIGFNYLTNISKENVYTSRFNENRGLPTRLGKKIGDRFIQPTNNVDYVNSLNVLNENEFKTQYGDDSKYGSSGPDIIKFFFYDIVNQKYIPFSATVKGIQDTNSAEWETVEYLGRPDKLYYYKGFTRELSFTFVVNAHSIKELLPMWQRINYLIGLTRPSNYTLGSAGGFMVPPMVQLTLGDFYKNHFVVIKNCNVAIPDDASWETIPEGSSYPNYNWSWGPDRSITWSDTNNLINPRGEKSDSQNRFAQFPRTAEISVQMSILEKDRPKTGRAAWGDARVPIVNGTDVYGTYDEQNGTVTPTSPDNFSSRVRYDTDLASLTEILNSSTGRSTINTSESTTVDNGIPY